MIERLFHISTPRATWGIDLARIHDPELAKFCPKGYKHGIRLFDSHTSKHLVIATKHYCLTIWFPRLLIS